VRCFILGDSRGIYQWVGNVCRISFCAGWLCCTSVSICRIIGLKLWMDMPEDAMEITNFVFSPSNPLTESKVCLSFWTFAWSR
jgi:hypothetical protein